MRTAQVLAVVLVALLTLPPLVDAQSVAERDTNTGRLLQFPIVRFNDTVFTNFDSVSRVAFDARGDLWYTSASGVVHVDVAAKTRELFTRFEGLPSSYSTSIAVLGGKAYVGTDLGVGVIDVASGRVDSITRANSQLPDDIVTEVAADGEDLWIGTHFGGVARYNTTRAEFTGFKNTSISVNFPQPITRVFPGKDAVWIGTRGDGAWRYDRANGTYEVIIKADGLATNDVLSIAERGRNVYFGTDIGLQRWAPDFKGTADEWLLYNKTRGPMPDERVFDVDVLPTEGGKADVFASTRRGLWQLNPESGQSITRNQTFGILGTFITENVYSPDFGWAFATTRGVSLKRLDNWTYYTTGPTRGVTNGPLSFGFTSASVDNDGRYLWFGSPEGISAYRLSTPERPGKWQNFGPWQNYPGSVVNWIDTEGNVTWFGTNLGAYGFAHADGKWIPMLSRNSRNLVYGLEASQGELWVTLFGDGMIAVNLTTGIERIFTYESTLFPITDQLLTDVRVQGDTVWVGSSIGVIKIHRVTGQVERSYGQGDGIPGSGVVFRTLPDGPALWVGTRDGGVARFDIATGRVNQVWNSSNIEGFPQGEVRAIHREGPRLWIGTENGVARIDLTTGRSTTFTQQNSGLVQNIVNGITSADGIVYVATLSGLSRFDTATEQWYPLRDGPGIVRGTPGSGSAGGLGSVSVTIDSPRDGVGVTGVVDVRGTALAFGGQVDLVEVRVGEGDWQPAFGTESWTWSWDTAGLPLDKPIVLAARATAEGEVSRVVEHLVTPVAAPKVPLSLDPVVLTNGTALRPFTLATRAFGDEPLDVVAFYRTAASRGYTQLSLTREGSFFTGDIPGREVREGNLTYYFRATSGRLEETAPEDLTQPFVAAIAPPPRLGVLLEAAPNVTASAGSTTPVPLTVTNTGTEPVAVAIHLASGLRASWVTVPTGEVRLDPGASRTVNATIDVPAAAADANVTFTFEARDPTGVADPSSVKVPVRVLATQGNARPTSAPQDPIPAPGIALVVLVALALALARRRSS